MTRISVVLPAPLGPSTASTWPCGTSRSTPCRAAASPCSVRCTRKTSRRWMAGSDALTRRPPPHAPGAASRNERARHGPHHDRADHDHERHAEGHGARVEHGHQRRLGRAGVGGDAHQVDDERGQHRSQSDAERQRQARQHRRAHEQAPAQRGRPQPQGLEVVELRAAVAQVAQHPHHEPRAGQGQRQQRGAGEHDEDAAGQRVVDERALDGGVRQQVEHVERRLRQRAVDGRAVRRPDPQLDRPALPRRRGLDGGAQAVDVGQHHRQPAARGEALQRRHHAAVDAVAAELQGDRAVRPDRGGDARARRPPGSARRRWAAAAAPGRGRRC